MVSTERLGQHLPTVLYYFCDYREESKSSTIGLLKSLLGQLLLAYSTDGSVLDVFALASRDSSSAGASSIVELLQLLRLATRLIPKSCYIVIDGVDECERGDRQRDIIQPLSELAIMSDSVKVLILSRPCDIMVKGILSKHPSITLSAEHTSGDIRLYVSSHIEKIFELGLDQSSPSPKLTKSDVTDRLTIGSNGMFLWARLMVKLLESPALFPSQRDEIIRSVRSPEGIETLYSRILKNVSRRRAHERNMAAKAFTWLTYSGVTLTAPELEAALVPDGARSPQSIINFPAVIQWVSGDLIEISGGNFPNQPIWHLWQVSNINPGSRCQFIHRSVEEHIKQVSTEGRHSFDLILNEEKSRLSIAITCLEYMLRTVQSGPLSGALRQRARLSDINIRYPLLRYSSGWFLVQSHAISMLCPKDGCGDLTARLFSSVERFVNQREVIMTWVEAFFLYRHNWEPAHLSSLSNLAGYLAIQVSSSDILRSEIDIVKSTIEFCSLLKTIWDEFRQVLWEDSHEIWTGLTDYLPGRTILNPRERVVKCIPEPPVQQDFSWGISPLLSISETSHDGQSVSSASLWVPK